ncbi:hypothetical protein BTJ39_22390 [Izhakiella australiensis]|uniref:IclR family transcriptional regulator n=1 Tax=Izhakiella australiensis TaxID=1926881 RepID=A0A1S8Y9U6_9GAMM|nr:hypothetical protein [Izhakiella australiensis]OON35626.1 hypothetical protein BTJ39_22390 [Izhakiella australiensis]
MKTVNEEIADLFSNGGIYRIEEIAAKTGFSKTVIRSALNEMLMTAQAQKVQDPHLAYRHAYCSLDARTGFGISPRLNRLNELLAGVRHETVLVRT